MKKRFWLMMVVLVVVLLCGCGEKEKPAETTTETVEETTKSAEDMTPEEIQYLIESRLEEYESENPGDVVWPLQRQTIRWPDVGTQFLFYHEYEEEEAYRILSRQLIIMRNTASGEWRISGYQEDIEWLQGWIGEEFTFDVAEGEDPLLALNEEGRTAWQKLMMNLKELDAREDVSVCWILDNNMVEIDVDNESRIVLDVYAEGGELKLTKRQLFWNQEEWVQDNVIRDCGASYDQVRTSPETSANRARKTARQQEPEKNMDITITTAGVQNGKPAFLVENKGDLKELLGIEVEQFLENEWRETHTREYSEDYEDELWALPAGETRWEIYPNDLLLQENVPTRFILYYEDGTASWCEFEIDAAAVIPENPDQMSEDTESFIRIDEPEISDLAFSLRWYTKPISHELAGTAVGEAQTVIKESYANHSFWDSSDPGYWGGIYATWEEMQAAIQINMVKNPLENLPIKGMKNASYLGMIRNAGDVSQHATVGIYGDEQGRFLELTGECGYNLDGIRITTSFEVETDLQEPDTSAVNYGSEFSVTEEIIAGENIIIIESSSDTYYSESAHFVDGEVYYMVDIVAEAGQKEDAKALLRELVPLYFK